MLEDILAGLTIPGLPGWASIALLLVLALVALAYLLMPFSVFGVKARLEAIEARLDDIQTEIRSLALRLPEPSRRRAPPLEDDWVEPPRFEEPPLRGTPPVPPPAAWPERGAGRAEPRLDWPRDRR